MKNADDQSGSSVQTVGVVFNVPVDKTFSYLVPDGADVAVGMRVLAPFGRRSLVGFVVAVDPHDAGGRRVTLKTLERVIDAEPVFTQAEVDLSRWMATMYMATAGECLATMIPTGRRDVDLPGLGFGDDDIMPRAVTLSAQQLAAVATIADSTISAPVYVYGITGSGKTEVFLQAARRVIDSGKSVIYLVPEISLTHQLVDAIRARFADQVAVLHSLLTPAQRITEWRRALDGRAKLVVGARSAVFAPCRELGLVIIDEEHEGSYKSGSHPRYHARQVAMRRCAAAGGRLVMGSATPSVEAWQMMATGVFRKVELTERLSGGALPSFEIVNLSGVASILSERLVTLVRSTHAEGRQSILFLNRRGFSHFFHCRSCGFSMQCARCSVGLTFHKERNLMVCHYCGYQTAPIQLCPQCASLDVGYAGFGTEQVEDAVKQTFPLLRIKRLDTDTAKTKGSTADVIDEFRRGEIDVLLGTQMVAKGLNFPGVKLVGIILADTGMHIPDFRAAERTFALLVQVAGRAGRYLPDGHVLVQTFQPQAVPIQFAARDQIAGFYQYELAQRRELGFPPFSRLIRLVVRGKQAPAVRAAAAEIAQAVSAALPRAPGTGANPAATIVLGPAECPLGMINRNYRRQLLVATADFAGVHRRVAGVVAQQRLPTGVYLEVDVDPVSLL